MEGRGMREISLKWMGFRKGIIKSNVIEDSGLHPADG